MYSGIIILRNRKLISFQLENKFKIGDVVFASAHPEVLLTVKRYIDRLYYCIVKDTKDEVSLLYFEIELEEPIKWSNKK